MTIYIPDVLKTYLAAAVAAGVLLWAFDGKCADYRTDSHDRWGNVYPEACRALPDRKPIVVRVDHRTPEGQKLLPRMALARLVRNPAGGQGFIVIRQSIDPGSELYAELIRHEDCHDVVAGQWHRNEEPR